MNYFFFDVDADRFDDEAHTVGYLVTDCNGVILAKDILINKDDILEIRRKFSNAFNKYFNNNLMTIVAYRPYPLITNFLNACIDDGYIENMPYVIIDLYSILFAKGKRDFRIKQSILSELEEASHILLKEIVK